jgi:hypothetical protein
VGRNAAIKKFDATPDGQPMELLDTTRGKAPIIVELLRSPWIARASDLVRRDGTCATKRREEPLEVTWNTERQCPVKFVRTGRLYLIDEIVQVWATERAWWDPRRHVSRRYWRVLARGGIYDLAYDRIAGVWLLVGVQD